MTLVSGQQLVVLTPFAPRKGSPFFCAASCSASDAAAGRAWLERVVPQLAGVRYLGREAARAVLRPGDTLYVPKGWTANYYNLEVRISREANRAS